MRTRCARCQNKGRGGGRVAGARPQDEPLGFVVQVVGASEGARWSTLAQQQQQEMLDAQALASVPEECKSFGAATCTAAGSSSARILLHNAEGKGPFA